MNRRFVLNALLLTLSLMACSVPSRPSPGPFITPTPTVLPTPVAGQWTVYPDLTLGAINPLVYGVNHGPWAALTPSTLPYAQQAGLTLIRFPGGNWGDEHDLTPAHLDQIVSLAQQLGAGVMIHVRLFGGTPEQAAALVRYANLEQHYAIRYWAIGNEPSLYATARGAPDYGVERFNKEWRAFAEAMRAVDPTIQLVGPELHQFGASLETTPKDPFGLDWMTEFLKANGDLVNIVSIHRYPFPQGRGNRAATIAELRASAAEWDALIPYLRTLIRDTTGRDLPIAVTEINSHWTNATGGEATPDAFYNAIWWADVLGRLIAQDVTMVTYFTLQSNPAIGGYGLLARSAPRPTYYVYTLYRQLGRERLHATNDDSRVGLYAARRDDGALTVLLVNLSDEPVARPLVIEGATPRRADLWRLDEQTPAELVTTLDVSGAIPLELPARSVTLIILTP